MKRKGSIASGILFTYCEVDKKLIRSYTPEDVVTAAESEVTRCVQRNWMTEEEFKKAIWKNSLPCGSVFSEAQLKGILLEGRRLSLRHHVRNLWSTNYTEDLGTLQRYEA